MWSFRPSQSVITSLSILGLMAVSACTVEPLHASRPDSQIASGQIGTSTRDILAATKVDPVNTRVAQQVRNALLFSMNGGRLNPGGQYSLSLNIVSASSNLSINNDSLAPTSARVTITANYKLRDVSTRQIVAAGRRSSFAAYDRTPQSFANERAQRDAENRAAKEVAQQLRLAVAQNIAGL